MFGVNFFDSLLKYVGAQSFISGFSLVIEIDPTTADLLRCEAGISCSISADFWSTATSTYVQLSVIREKRFRGDTEKALFNGSCPMTLIGLYPSRTLGALNVGVDLSFCENRKLSLYYRGKYCDDYRENSLNLEFAF